MGQRIVIKCQRCQKPIESRHDIYCYRHVASKEPLPEKELRELFLVVADICDGAKFDREMRELLDDAYAKVFNTSWGHITYSEAVDGGELDAVQCERILG